MSRPVRVPALTPANEALIRRHACRYGVYAKTRFRLLACRWEGPFSARQLAEAAGVDPKQAYKYLDRLMWEGSVEKLPRGLWQAGHAASKNAEQYEAWADDEERRGASMY